MAELPIPSGWYGLGLARELGPGDVRAVRRFGRDLVLFRTEDGDVSLLDAYCPHLGAHMGRGGRIEDGQLVCPFHAFRFDTAGRCTGSGYGTKAPRNADIESLPVREVNGFLLAWYGAEGEAPSFEIPELERDGWGQTAARAVRLKTHPQETSENSVDVGHLAVVHGYRNIRMLDDVQVEGPHLTVRYGMTRENPFPIPGALDVSFRIHVWGLGYSLVEVSLPEVGLEVRNFILSAPEEVREVELIAASSVRYRGPGALQRFIPRLVRSLAGDLLSPVMASALRHDVLQDKEIWEHKRYEARPRLARGDGPVGRYRQYVRQFYPRAA